MIALIVTLWFLASAVWLFNAFRAAHNGIVWFCVFSYIMFMLDAGVGVLYLVNP